MRFELGTQAMDSVSDDLLRGAQAIALFLFGDAGKRRQVYHLAQTRQLPVFRLGSTLCARRSTLVAWIAEQEAHAVGQSQIVQAHPASD